MNRIRLGGSLALPIAWIAALFIGLVVNDAHAEERRPNVLFIAVDDLNDWVGVMQGHPQVRTPNLDRLAARGTFFDRAYCASPSCQPSRVAVLTGLRSSTSGVYVNGQKMRGLLPNAVTLPQYFTKHGYRTAGGGKVFHHGDLDPQSWPEYFDQPQDPEPDPLIAGPINSHFTWQPLDDVGDEAMGDYQVVSWARDWLAAASPGPDAPPFFLAVGFYRPHMPLHVPRSYFDRHPLDQLKLPVLKPGDEDDLPPIGHWTATNRGYHEKITAAGEYEKAVQGYLASIEFFDGQLGRLIDALDASEHGKNTIVVLWSDHGWDHGQKRHWSKFALWEQSTRVPLLVVAPGLTTPGSRCSATVSLLDLYPTLAELCNLPRPAEAEGQSLVPQLRDVAAPRVEPAVMTFGPNNHAVRDARWRYIRYFDGGEELYDHDADPHEWTNLADRAELQPTKDRLKQWLPKVNKPLTTPTVWLHPDNVTPADRDPRADADGPSSCIRHQSELVFYGRRTRPFRFYFDPTFAFDTPAGRSPR